MSKSGEYTSKREDFICECGVRAWKGSIYCQRCMNKIQKRNKKLFKSKNLEYSKINGKYDYGY